MTADERAAAKARCDAATPGRWVAFPTGVLSGARWVVCNTDVAIPRAEDANFIAHARTDLPAAAIAWAKDQAPGPAPAAPAREPAPPAG
jgi:hypothetical protein